MRKKKLKDTSVPVWLEAADEAHAADDKNMLDVQKAESGLIMMMGSGSSTQTHKIALSESKPEAQIEKRGWRSELSNGCATD
jgi:hypothetical protein